MLDLHIWDFEDMMSEAYIRSEFRNLSTTNVTFTSRHSRKDGSTYAVEVTATGAKVRGEPMVLTISRDITDRLRAEKAIKTS